MADVSQLEVNGTTYNICDATARDSLSQYCPFPVGAVYLTFDNSDPSTIWTGTTWTQIAAGTFLVASGTNYNLRATGGAASVTLTSAQSGIPAHAHGLNGHVHSVGAHNHGLNSHIHSVGAHSHGLNSHKHNYDKANSTSDGTSITIANLPKNYAKFSIPQRSAGSGTTGLHGAAASENGAAYGANAKVSYGSGNYMNPVDYYTGITNSLASVVTLTGSGSAHSHTITYTSTASAAASGSTANSTAFDSGAASGNTANSTAFDSGAATGNTANNTAANASSAHENRPPYMAVAMWERTA